MTLISICFSALISDVSHDEAIENVINAMNECKTPSERMVLFDQATSSPYYYMNADQALLLYSQVSSFIAGDLEVIAGMLSQIVNPENCVR